MDCIFLAEYWRSIIFCFTPGVNEHPSKSAPAVPLWWPAVLMSLCLACVQLASWTPLAQSWLRIFIAIPLLMAIGGIAAAIGLLPIPEPIAVISTAALLPIVYLLIVRVVARDRRGDAFDWRLWNQIVARVASWRQPALRPFASPSAAQLWFESRGNGWLLPLFVGSMMLLLSPMVTCTDRDDLSVGWRLLAIVCVVPLLLAGAIGAQLGKRDSSSKTELGPFLATRPLRTNTIVCIKLEMAALSCLATWLVVFLFMSPILTRPGFAQSIINASHHVGFWKTSAFALLVFVGLPAVTWLQLASSLWMGLTGYEWIVNVLVIGFGVLMMACGTVGFWIYLHPEWRPVAEAAMPWVVGFAIAVKLLTAAWISFSLLRAGLFTGLSLATMIGIWSLAVSVLCLIAFWLLPSQLWSASNLFTVALLVPFSRIAAGPLALHWNRHR